MASDTQKESETSHWKERLQTIQSQLTFNGDGLDENGDTLAYHLFKAGAPAPFLVETFGSFSLYVAFSYPSENFYQRTPELLAAGADPNEVTPPWTVLHLAAFMGTAAQVGMLLEAGANVSALNDKGESPLDVAIGNRNEETIRVLEACVLERHLEAVLPSPPRSAGRPRM